MDMLLLVFAASVAFFHLSEAILVALINPMALSWRSLLISRPYCLAMSCAMLEYLLEGRLFPTLKVPGIVSCIGAAMIVAGELLRKTAIVTAGRSFTHRVADTLVDGHRLVTHGVYARCRHPGYAGWLLWCVGTQVLLVNPLAAIAFAVVAWRFFAERILFEERFLVQFFRDDYRDYKKSVGAGIPFME